MMNGGYGWIVNIDLEKFFDTVNHDRLMALIGKRMSVGDNMDADDSDGRFEDEDDSSDLYC